ncbi:uncharacterized protein LOC143594318 isoform X1 [Bidens hawaiensis]|uniref:uncharacterized protein LOC143594318 isoform X1 n=1 Tax=Bidens hawaiensis TaxID=980011 RepID=UPI00404A5DAF
MATSTIAFVILLLTLSSTIHARESQFFSKFSNNNVKQTPTLNNNNQQTPDLVPQSQDTESYGHESGQLSPSATTTNNNNNNNNNNNLPSYLPKNYNPVAYTTPIHSNTQDIPEEFNDPQTYNSGSELYNSQNQEEFVETNGDNTYNSEKQGMSDTRFLENGKYYYNGGGDANTYNSPKQGFEDARFMETEEDVGNTYNSEKQEVGETKYSTSNNADMYNNERQGMSDTRFLENGKYYYDLNMENVNNANARNEYNTQGYYGNDGKLYDNSYDRYNFNSNGGYQNQEEFQVDQFNP